MLLKGLFFGDKKYGQWTTTDPGPERQSTLLLNKVRRAEE